jgi:hypothetical protein
MACAFFVARFRHFQIPNVLIYRAFANSSLPCNLFSRITICQQNPYLFGTPLCFCGLICPAFGVFHESHTSVAPTLILCPSAKSFADLNDGNSRASISYLEFD